MQRQSTGCAVNAAQVGRTDVEHSIVLNICLPPHPVTYAGDRQVVTNVQDTVLQRGACHATVLQLRITRDLCLGQVQQAIDRKIQVTGYIQQPQRGTSTQRQQRIRARVQRIKLQVARDIDVGQPLNLRCAQPRVPSYQQIQSTSGIQRSYIQIISKVQVHIIGASPELVGRETAANEGERLISVQQTC